MPRGGRGSSGGRSSYKPARNPPKRATSAPPPAPATSGSAPIRSGFVGSMLDGLGWGSGMSLANRAVDKIFGPRQYKVTDSANAPTSAQSTNTNLNGLGSGVCAAQTNAFQECLNSNSSDISKCQIYMDMLSECRRNPDSELMV